MVLTFLRNLLYLEGTFHGILSATEEASFYFYFGGTQTVSRQSRVCRQLAWRLFEDLALKRWQYIDPSPQNFGLYMLLCSPRIQIHLIYHFPEQRRDRADALRIAIGWVCLRLLAHHLRHCRQGRVYIQSRYC